MKRHTAASRVNRYTAARPCRRLSIRPASYDSTSWPSSPTACRNDAARDGPSSAAAAGRRRTGCRSLHALRRPQTADHSAKPANWIVTVRVPAARVAVGTRAPLYDVGRDRLGEDWRHSGGGDHFASQSGVSVLTVRTLPRRPHLRLADGHLRVAGADRRLLGWPSLAAGVISGTSEPLFLMSFVEHAGGRGSHRAATSRIRCRQSRREKNINVPIDGGKCRVWKLTGSNRWASATSRCGTYHSALPSASTVPTVLPSHTSVALFARSLGSVKLCALDLPARAREVTSRMEGVKEKAVHESDGRDVRR